MQKQNKNINHLLIHYNFSTREDLKVTQPNPFFFRKIEIQQFFFKVKQSVGNRLRLATKYPDSYLVKI